MVTKSDLKQGDILEDSTWNSLVLILWDERLGTLRGCWLSKILLRDKGTRVTAGPAIFSRPLEEFLNGKWRVIGNIAETLRLVEQEHVKRRVHDSDA